MLWGKKCRSYRGSKLGGFWAITPERLRVQRANFVISSHAAAKRKQKFWGAHADGKIFRKFLMTAAWEGGKVYGFLLGFRTVNFVISSHAAAKRKQKFCVKIWFRNSQGLLRN